MHLPWLVLALVQADPMPLESVGFDGVWKDWMDRDAVGFAHNRLP